MMIYCRKWINLVLIVQQLLLKMYYVELRVVITDTDKGLSRVKLPLPLFDTLEYLPEDCILSTEFKFTNDYAHALSFLKCYSGSKGTFNSYRREVERLLHWSWTVINKSL